MGHSLGASVDGDLDVFLGPSWEEVTETIFPSGDQQQFEARFAYGFPARNNHVTISPALAWILSPGRRITSLGSSFSPFSGLDAPPEAEPWEVSLEGERQQYNTSTTPDCSLQLGFSLQSLRCHTAWCSGGTSFWPALRESLTSGHCQAIGHQPRHRWQMAPSPP